jgi:hypothetical protein
VVSFALPCASTMMCCLSIGPKDMVLVDHRLKPPKQTLKKNRLVISGIL